MVDRPSKINKVRMFIKNLQHMYKQHLTFIPFENFITLRHVSMLVEEELAWETSTITTNTWKDNYHNKDKKENSSTSKEAPALDC